MTSSTARAELVALLAPLEEADGADTRVLPYARDVDPVDRPTVMVRVDEVKPRRGVIGSSRLRDYTFALVLIPSSLTGAAAEDELDEVLELTLAELEAIQTDTSRARNLEWTTATRGSYLDKFPAYEITVTLPLKIGA